MLEAPIDRIDDPRAKRYIVDHLAPGTTIQRKVRVANSTPETQVIELYPAAATVESEQFLFTDGRTPNELTSWISLDHNQMPLDPYHEGEAEVTIQVPPKASAGERYAVIWAAVSSKPDPTANVMKIHRVGIRVYLDIGPGGEPPSDFAIGKLSPARDKFGVPSTTIQVTNTGGRALDMSGSVLLIDGPAGMRAGPFDVMKGTTLGPGAKGTVKVQFPRELPNGPWKIEINLESGIVKHPATAKIVFPDPDEAGTTVFARMAKATFSVAALWVLLALLIAAGVVFAAYRSRNANRSL